MFLRDSVMPRTRIIQTSVSAVAVMKQQEALAVRWGLVYAYEQLMAPAPTH